MDQLSEIQTADMPTPPTPTGNVRADSAARAAYEAELTRYFEQRGQGFQQRGAIPLSDATAQPTRSVVEPNAQDLAGLKAMHADAVKRFPGNSQVLALIDQGYRDVFGGKRLDFDALSEALAQAVETSEDREIQAAVDELASAVDEDGAVAHDKIPSRLMRGYSLPVGEYNAEETVSLLRVAANLGLTQDQVNAFVQMQLDGEA
jgi:hypothetical protein